MWHIYIYVTIADKTYNVDKRADWRNHRSTFVSLIDASSFFVYKVTQTLTCSRHISFFLFTKARKLWPVISPIIAFFNIVCFVSNYHIYTLPNKKVTKHATHFFWKTLGLLSKCFPETNILSLSYSSYTTLGTGYCVQLDKESNTITLTIWALTSH